jgi:D-alanyl-D-alanine dipeptidase
MAMKRNIWFAIVFWILAPCGTWGESSAMTIPAGFVDIQEEIPSIVVDMRYHSSHNFVGERIPGYDAPKCLLTREAANALKSVQQELRQDALSLKVYDCYRPQRAVDYFVVWAKNSSKTRMKKEFYPTVAKHDLFRKGYLARKSSHSRGSTVDLTIVPLPVPEQEQYIPGQELFECYLPVEQRFKDNSLDMGTGFDCFHDRAATHHVHLTAQQRTHRLLLKTLMEQHGFKNYSKEWWHFTLRNEPFPTRYFDFVIEE